jgi:hypothetical protein
LLALLLSKEISGIVRKYKTGSEEEGVNKEKGGIAF